MHVSTILSRRTREQSKSLTLEQLEKKVEESTTMAIKWAAIPDGTQQSNKYWDAASYYKKLLEKKLPTHLSAKYSRGPEDRMTAKHEKDLDEAIAVLTDEFNSGGALHVAGILGKVAVEGGEEAQKAIILIANLSQA